MNALRCPATSNPSSRSETERGRSNGLTYSANRIYEYPNVRSTTVKSAAQFFKVLADEARLQILWLLFNHRELCVCDIMETLGITQSKTSRHLATLRHAQLVTDRKDAAWTYYSLRTPESGLERAILHTLRTTLADRPDAARMLEDLRVRAERNHRKAGCVVVDVGAAGCARKRGGRARANGEELTDEDSRI